MRRRNFLVGTLPFCTGVAGCSEVFSDTSMLSLAVINHSDSLYTVEVALLQNDEESTRSEARVFSEPIEVEPNSQTVREDVAAVQPYIIEYSAYEDDTSLTDQDHVHYYPADESEDDTQAFDIDSSGVLTWR